jgi:hypothetical protein
VSPYMLDALMRDYWCAVAGHIVSWNAGGTSDTYRPDEAPCERCGRVIKLEKSLSGERNA